MKSAFVIQTSAGLFDEIDEATAVIWKSEHLTISALKNLINSFEKAKAVLEKDYYLFPFAIRNGRPFFINSGQIDGVIIVRRELFQDRSLVIAVLNVLNEINSFITGEVYKVIFYEDGKYVDEIPGIITAEEVHGVISEYML